ncbi:uncharacterized protein [Littorina saxatilis]|uniref:uncharacterized protein n=1 Tax=Littorina saxatilis TaxID=31220 RepID=UPI0038B4EF23
MSSGDLPYWTKRRRIRADVSKCLNIVKATQQKQGLPLADDIGHDDDHDVGSFSHKLSGDAPGTGSVFDLGFHEQCVGFQGDEALSAVCDLSEDESECIAQAFFVDDVNNEENLQFDRLLDTDRLEAARECDDIDNESASECEDEEVVDGELLASELRNWATLFNIPLLALNGLLSVLKVFHPNLPKDSRTLLKTPVRYDIKDVQGGSYHHFGVIDSLSSLLTNANDVCRDVDGFWLQVSIDGLPLFKSSSVQLWPIVGMVVKPFVSDPFLIGLYCGEKKPGSVDEYLHDFVQEMQVLERGPVFIPVCNREVSVHISCFVCDAPARAFVKNVKGHSGYHGCEKCTQKGVYEKKVIFPEVTAASRTDVAFNEMSDVNHHHGPSPLHGLASIGLVSQFPLDFMHMVCLGVTRRLLLCWVKSPVSKGLRLGSRGIAMISERLVLYKNFIPREFSRQCRPLADLERWKATEFRQFLLYSGVVALKGELPDKLYRHFLLLFVAIFCLASPTLYTTHAMYAKDLLIYFVAEAGRLYGQDFLVYNVHGLVHLADDVKTFGPLDRYSAFPFENFLCSLKSLLFWGSIGLQG